MMEPGLIIFLIAASSMIILTVFIRFCCKDRCYQPNSPPSPNNCDNTFGCTGHHENGIHDVPFGHYDPHRLGNDTHTFVDESKDDSNHCCTSDTSKNESCDSGCGGDTGGGDSGGGGGDCGCDSGGGGSDD